MTYTAGDFYDAINGFAPFSTAASGDNAGLLIGARHVAVKAALVALDATAPVIEEAVRLGANLIITHHPVIFSPLKQIGVDDVVYKLIAAGISVISAHTNLDAADGGVNDVLCDLLELKDVRPLESAVYPGLARIGRLPDAIDTPAFAGLVCEAVAIPTLKFTDSTASIKTVAVCGGSGGDLMPEAMAAGAQALVTADVKHHQFIAAKAADFVLIDAGHYATEVAVIKPFAERLSALLPGACITVSLAQQDPAAYMICD